MFLQGTGRQARQAGNFPLSHPQEVFPPSPVSTRNKGTRVVYMFQCRAR